MSEINVDAATEALRLIGQLRVALALDQEAKQKEQVRAMNERAIRDIVTDARVNVHELKPLVPAGDPPPPAPPPTVPVGQVDGIRYLDNIALAFAGREKLEAIANQLDIARKLSGK